MPRARFTLADLHADPALAARLRSPAAELLDGEVVVQPLPSAAVVAAVVQLASSLDERAVGLRVGVRAAVAAWPRDLLRPEVSVSLPGVPTCVRPAPPATSLALAVLVVEHVDVAQARLRRYALAGIPETWVLAPTDGIGAAYRDAQAGRYRRRELLLPGEPCAPREAPWLQVIPLLRRQAEAGGTTASAAAGTTAAEAAA